jgi:DNA-binding XRE family transcriptional regulator
MPFTRLPYRAIPEAGKPANGFGMAKVPGGKPDFSDQRALGQRVDDAGGVIGLHSLTMPNSLAQVKTSERGLPQIIWRDIVPPMDLDSRPFGDIAERLRWHRQLEGLEQREYAEKAGLKRAQLSNWESGDYRLSLDGARALRRTYGLSLDFMFEGIDDALPMTLRAAWRDRPSVK